MQRVAKLSSLTAEVGNLAIHYLSWQKHRPIQFMPGGPYLIHCNRVCQKPKSCVYVYYIQYICIIHLYISRLFHQVLLSSSWCTSWFILHPDPHQRPPKKHSGSTPPCSTRTLEDAPFGVSGAKHASNKPTLHTCKKFNFQAKYHDQSPNFRRFVVHWSSIKGIPNQPATSVEARRLWSPPKDCFWWLAKCQMQLIWWPSTHFCWSFSKLCDQNWPLLTLQFYN